MKELNENEMVDVVGGGPPTPPSDAYLAWLWAQLFPPNTTDHHVDMYGNPLEI